MTLTQEQAGILEEGLVQAAEQFFSTVWGSVVIWFGGVLAVTQFIRKVSKDFDTDLAPEKRQLLAEILAGDKKWAAGSWVKDFTGVFDRFFGKKHFRWRCIYRSSLISIVTFSVLVLSTDLSFGQTTLLNFAGIGAILTMGVIMNAFIDYWSLLETRFLLKTPLPTSVKILVDAILTVLLALGWFSFMSWLVQWVFMERRGFLVVAGSVLESFAGINQVEEMNLLVQIMVATSFTTSIWLWLHGLAQLTIRGLNFAESLMSWLNVKERPLRAIGTTINAFVLLFGVVLFFPFAFAG